MFPWPLDVARSGEAVAVGAALVACVAGGLRSAGDVLAGAVPCEEVPRDARAAGAYDEVYRTRQ